MLPSRPAAGGPLDSNTIRISLPTFVPERLSQSVSDSWYFVTVDLPSLNSDGGSDAISTSTSLTVSSKRSSGRSWQLPVCTDLEGLELGHPIACGSYGRVFLGKYFGTQVGLTCVQQ